MEFNILTFGLILLLVYCIHIIIYEKRSVRSKLIETTVAIAKPKKLIENDEVYNKYIEKMAIKNKETYILPKFKYKCDIKRLAYKRMDYYVVNQNDKAKKIFYLHGGSYIEDPLIFHWIFLDEIAKITNTEIIVPIYPKSPTYNYKYAYKKVLGLYKNLCKKENIIIMGDSAGGGFALGLAQLLKKKEMKSPSNIILLSPWLDITMKNKEIEKYESNDPFLSKNTLIKSGNYWSKGDDNYLVSPIKGEFKKIGKITIFVGTHEIFLPDAKKLKDKLVRKHIPHNYYEFHNMDHVFPLQPIPEAKKAKDIIIKIINEA